MGDMSDRLKAAMDVDAAERTRRASLPPLWIYVIEEDGGKFCKVGITSDNIARRLRELQLGNSRKLTVLLHEPLPNPRRVERMAHSLMWNHYQGHEWFHIDGARALSAVKEAIEAERGKSDEGFTEPPLAGGWPARHAERGQKLGMEDDQ
jgi:hypothetical protein